MTAVTGNPEAQIDKPPVDPTEFGIGLRYSLHPASDDFVDVILGAIKATEQAGLADGLEVTTDSVSTYVGARQAPAEGRLASYLQHTIATAARLLDGRHLVSHILLSRGCPGEVTCDLSVSSLPESSAIELEPSGVLATAQWSLYPLMDGASDGGEHLAPIMKAIEEAADFGVDVTQGHYATFLRGDLSAVLATIFTTWARVGQTVPHVVTHATISIASPSDSKDQS